MYGPLANHTTGILYEGAPEHPAWIGTGRSSSATGSHLLHRPDRDPRVRKAGDEHVEKHDLSSLRLLGTVGEPINPEAWIWYHEHVGGGRCPIVDTWWQTETGAIMISPLPGVTTTKPGSASRPLPGVAAVDRRREGQRGARSAGAATSCSRTPWPAMLRTF